MQKKILHIFLLVIFCITLSCKSKVFKESYIVSKFEDIQILEQQDHKFCTSLNLNSGKDYNNSKSNLYWRCRLALSKSKFRAENGTPENTKFNFQINDLVSKIALNLSEMQESVFIRENKKIDGHQHQQCVRMGYESDTLDQSKLDDYFLCRKRLIEDQELDPPFGNIDYLKYPNHSYDIGFVVDNRLEKEAEKYKTAKEKYPTCTQYNLRKENFKKCSAAQDKSRKCMSEIDRNKFKKEAEEKIICQRKSYIQYPDLFLEEEDVNKKDIAEAKTNADVYNQNNFAALGISGEDMEKFSAEKNKEEEKEKAKANINSKNGLYSKVDLTRLRQRYILSCTKEADVRILQYAEDLKKSCEDMMKFEAIDE